MKHELSKGQQNQEQAAVNFPTKIYAKYCKPPHYLRHPPNVPAKNKRYPQVSHPRYEPCWRSGLSAWGRTAANRNVCKACLTSHQKRKTQGAPGKDWEIRFQRRSWLKCCRSSRWLSASCVGAESAIAGDRAALGGDRVREAKAFL